jgi:hypothetical protein
MKLPNGDRAVVDIRKLRDYCLNPNHPVGKHKARLFKSLLGIVQDDANELRMVLLQAAATANAIKGKRDKYGQRYTVHFDIARGSKMAIIESGWIILTDEDFPRFVTCYPRKRKK